MRADDADVGCGAVPALEIDCPRLSGPFSRPLAAGDMMRRLVRNRPSKIGLGIAAEAQHPPRKS